MSIHEREHDLRTAITSLYRALRDGASLDAALRDQWSPAQGGRALRVLVELGLVVLDGATAHVPGARRTELDRSEAFRAYRARGEDELRFLRTATAGTATATARAAAA